MTENPPAPLRIQLPAHARAVVGIRPCDAHAFQLVKVNFDNPEYRDPWWVKGFESTTLVGLGCTDPCPTCFCTSVGGGPFSEKGLDVLIYELGEDLVVKALTPKGEALLEKAEGGAPVDDAALKQVGSGGRGREGENHRDRSHQPAERKGGDRALQRAFLGGRGFFVYQLRDLYLSVPHVLVF